MTQIKKINSAARHKARRFALQAIYQWQLTSQAVNAITAQFAQEEGMQKADQDYFNELLKEVTKQHSELDQQLTPFLDRALMGLDPIELAILRIGVYELLKHPEIPYRVVINEAVELAKEFGAAEGHKYVNGLLDRVARQVRVLEN